VNAPFKLNNTKKRRSEERVQHRKVPRPFSIGTKHQGPSHNERSFNAIKFVMVFNHQVHMVLDDTTTKSLFYDYKI